MDSLHVEKCFAFGWWLGKLTDGPLRAAASLRVQSAPKELHTVHGPQFTGWVLVASKAPL